MNNGGPLIIRVLYCLAGTAILFLSSASAAVDTLPAYASASYAEGGGMGGPVWQITQVRKEGSTCQRLTGTLAWTVDARSYLLKDGLPPPVVRQTISETEFAEVWKRVEAGRLRERKQVEADRPPPDAAYSVFVARWGAAPNSAQTNDLVFRSDTATYRAVAPVIRALEKPHAR
jgi:hypothetical protein